MGKSDGVDLVIERQLSPGVRGPFQRHLSCSGPDIYQLCSSHESVKTPPRFLVTLDCHSIRSRFHHLIQQGSTASLGGLDGTSRPRRRRNPRAIADVDLVGV